ncbi:MAG: hypothetical protein QM737_22465 [Ferruginibacter sp.]
MPDKIAVDCHEHTLMQENIPIGKVYGGRKFTFLKLPANLVRIDRVGGFFSKPGYNIVDHSTGSYLGCLEFTWRECIITLQDKTVFYFHKDSSDKAFYKPSTWNKFRHEMTNSTDKIIFSGRINSAEIFDGSIETTNERLILPMMIGIYILEEKQRIRNENAG